MGRDGDDDLRCACARQAPARSVFVVPSAASPEIRQALSVNCKLAGMGKLPTEKRSRELVRARYDAEQALREAEWNAQRGKAGCNKTSPSRGRGAPRDRRDRIIGELERQYGGDLNRLASLFAEPKRSQAKRLGMTVSQVRTLERAREEFAEMVALGL
jgi:hypothetical protein